MRLLILGLVALFSLGGTAASTPLTLASDVAARAAGASGSMAVYVRALDERPPLVALRADERFPSASIIKVLIMVTAFAAAAQRPGLMAEPVTVHAADMVGGSEFLAAVRPGTHFPLRTLVRHMIVQSDNTASNALISYFGFDRINAEAQKIGMTNTVLKRHFLDWSAIVKHNENMTTAADMGVLLYEIARGAHEGIRTVASAQDCRAMIDIMLHQEDREKIPAGLPSGTRVANKTGEITGVRSDVAIVNPYGENPYVITVLTKDLGNYASGVRAIQLISRDVYRAVIRL